MRHTVDPAFVDSLGLAGAHQSVAAVAASVAAEAVLAQRVGQASSYSRNRSWYGAGASQVGGRDFTYTNVTRAVDLMEQEGFVTTTMGVYRSKLRPDETGRQSTFSATPKLIGLADVTPRILLRRTETIILKDADKVLQGYANTRETRSLRDDLQEWTESVRGSQIAIDAPDVAWTESGRVVVPHVTEDGDPAPIHIDVSEDFAFYRIFNNASFKQGGRCYGHFVQGLPETRRRQLVIDGEVVALLDYSASHPAMLYARAGVVMDGDPYTVPGFDRDMAKVGLMVVLNATGRPQGLHAMAHKLGGEKPLPENWNAAGLLLDALEARHAAIAPAFYMGSGLACQKIEADILADVSRQCRRENIVTLPVHDEMITPERHAGRVRELMMSCWHTRLGVDPKVK